MDIPRRRRSTAGLVLAFALLLPSAVPAGAQPFPFPPSEASYEADETTCGFAIEERATGKVMVPPASREIVTFPALKIAVTANDRERTYSITGPVFDPEELEDGSYTDTSTGRTYYNEFGDDGLMTPVLFVGPVRWTTVDFVDWEVTLLPGGKRIELCDELSGSRPGRR